MKILKRRMSMRAMVAALILLMPLTSCEDDFLQEAPIDTLSPENVLVDEKGFELYINGLHDAARDEWAKYDLNYYFNMSLGTDVATTGQEPAVNFRNYETYLIPENDDLDDYWFWAYEDMIMRANTIIHYAESEDLKDIWSSEESKNAIIAEAKFFRGYTHNLLANLWGGVPIATEVYSAPKTDFVRNSREEVYQSAREDLEFASQWLPETVAANKQGRIVKAAADHLLSEVYISLGEYDKAIQSASAVINSGLYHLMTERFGVEKDEPGDVFSDLFRTGNQNRTSGNMESIYVWQFEDRTIGGQGGQNRGNNSLRGWGPFLTTLRDPENKSGMIFVDSIGRGVGWVRPNTWYLYDLWEGDWNNDIRNSEHNIKRTYYYNNPSSKYFGQKVERKTSLIDTMQNVYPTIQKVMGKIVYNGTGGSNAGNTYSDHMVFRLAETYLLRAEAYMKNGDLDKAADDINVVRTRANASLIGPGDVTMDFILDERARELIVEEPRRRTLVRTGTLVERTRLYNMRESTRETIADKHMFWPIPQSAIDANFSVTLEQNPGY